MTKANEAKKIRREGFPITARDATILLDFINLYDSLHMTIEPDIIVKLEILSKKWKLTEGRK